MLPVHLPRLKAPRNHGELLAYPLLDDVGALLRDNRERFGPGSLLGRSLLDLRALARRDMLSAARAYLTAGGEPVTDFSSATWLVGGHQPELFHPGVWVKNFILQSLARRHDATPLNLVVDNDVAKTAALRVPAGERLLSVPFDEGAADVPFEERLVKDENLYRTLPERVLPLVSEWPFRPWVDEVWSEMLRAAPTTPFLGERIVRARRRLERSMGISPLEVPLSAMCRTEAFAWFACALLADLPRFLENYNAAVRQYRRLHGLRSKNHPVPDLVQLGDAFETPFWVWRADAPRRQRLFALRDSAGMQLLSGTTPVAHLRGNPEEWVVQWPALERQGIKIRTRALSTTLFSRLLLADLFVHGIGGGKYDEVTDAIFGSHFEREPPHYLVVTATLLLPFPRTPDLMERWHALNRLERDFWYNPQRHLLLDSEAAQAFIPRKQDALAMPQRTHEERIARFHCLLQATAQLRPLVVDQIAKLELERRDLEKRRRREELLAARDYAFCLYPEDMLRSFFQDIPGLKH